MRDDEPRPVWMSLLITSLYLCFITAGPITKLCAWGEEDGTREEPGTLTQGGALFSLVPLVWESNPKLQGGWCKTQPPAHRGI